MLPNKHTKAENLDIDNLTPIQITKELDKYVVGQKKAKRAVAIAVRNRVRRRLVKEDIRDEIYPKNIIMIGPTGCGKTEISRRLSKLTGTPFTKVEATKYTEVGYIGRDVESMVRDLVNTSVSLVRKEFQHKVKSQAEKNMKETLLDLLLPSSQNAKSDEPFLEPDFASLNLSEMGVHIQKGFQVKVPEHHEKAKNSKKTKKDLEREESIQKKASRVRKILSRKLDAGELEDRDIELESQASQVPSVQVLSGGPNLEELDMQVQNMLADILPRKQQKRRVSVSEARKILVDQEMEKLIDTEKVRVEAIRRAEQMGIIFIDELDKVCGKKASGSGIDVSREGVQRDLLPIVEGASVNTRYGTVKTDHILFIAAGAFHMTSPSDLIPELQGRFPIRVELEKLTEEDFCRILTVPRNALVRQTIALLETENVHLQFTPDSIKEIARFAFEVNEKAENIGARRLHTIMEHLIDDISFNAPDLPKNQRDIVIDKDFVVNRLASTVQDRDLSRYIL